MKKVEINFADQSRWNETKGKSDSARIQENPEAFLIDLQEFPPIKRDLINAMPHIQGKRILEFGSGRGELSVALAQLGAAVTGIDIGEDLVKLAQKIAAVNNVSCEFLVGSINQLQFPDATFDFVVGNAILHHLPQAGVTAAVEESYRVLKPGGMALFTEPIENSKLFDFVQNLIPVGRPGTPRYRPSILHRSQYKKFLAEADDRALSNAELRQTQGAFREIEFRYYGLLIRLSRIFPYPRLRQFLRRVDTWLTHPASPVKKLSQQVLVIYKK